MQSWTLACRVFCDGKTLLNTSLCSDFHRVCVHPSQAFTSQGSTRMRNARITCGEGVLWSLLQGSRYGWLHMCFVSSKTCRKLSVVFGTSEIAMYFVLWQYLDQLAAGMCCKAAANALCLCGGRWLWSLGAAFQLMNLKGFKQVLSPSTNGLNCPEATENCLYEEN